MRVAGGSSGGAAGGGAISGNPTYQELTHCRVGSLKLVLRLPAVQHVMGSFGSQSHQKVRPQS
jgi:hypothetical protein